MVEKSGKKKNSKAFFPFETIVGHFVFFTLLITHASRLQVSLQPDVSVRRKDRKLSKEINRARDEGKHNFDGTIKYKKMRNLLR